MSTYLSRNNEYKLFTFYPKYENVHALLMEIHLYVFGRDGSLIESQAIRRDKAVVALSENELHTLRIVIAPAWDSVSDQPLNLEMLSGRHVFITDVLMDASQSSYELPPVPESVWRWWLVDSLWKNVHLTPFI